MNTKLTLSVEKQVIQRAKRYAHRHNKSLSQIVSNYLDHLSGEQVRPSDIDPEVLDVADEIPVARIPELKDSRYKYLKAKHVHD